MTRATSRILLATGIAAGVLCVAVLILYFGRGPRPLPLPNPNGYDDLLKAAHAVTRKVDDATDLDDASDLDHAGLRALVATNSQALRWLRLGLSRECAVPTDAEIAHFSNIFRTFVGLKSLAQLLSAEGRLAEMENRPEDAARSYLDSIRLGVKMSRGGLMINRLVGIACEAIGWGGLLKLLPKLPWPQTRPLLARLEQIDTHTVPWEEVARNESRFQRAQWRHYRNPIAFVKDWWQSRGVGRAARDAHYNAAAHLRLITTEMALRCYRAAHGVAPARLGALVPDYLRHVPEDPFSGHALVYRPQGTNWLLYSIGPDRVDDGGKPAGRSDRMIGFGGDQSASQGRKGDLLYDSP